MSCSGDRNASDNSRDQAICAEESAAQDSRDGTEEDRVGDGRYVLIVTLATDSRLVRYLDHRWFRFVQ